MSSVKQRTQKDIMDYIRTHAKNGKLSQSLLDIAEHIGYSNATVHRALKALEDRGLVEIKPADRPTEPNTIVFKGELNQIDELLAKGVQISEDITQVANDLNEYINEVNSFIRSVSTKEASYCIPDDHIISVTDIPNTDLQQILMRKDMDATIGPM